MTLQEIVFSSLVSIRRKPKSDANLHHQLDQSLASSEQENARRQFNPNNAGSFVDSSSLHSINTHNTSDHHDAIMSKSASTSNIGYHANVDLITPNSPSSLNPPSIINAPSSTNEFSSQPVRLLFATSLFFNFFFLSAYSNLNL